MIGESDKTMSLQWDNFEQWYLEIRLSIKAAVDRLEMHGDDGKKRKKGAALQLLMRQRSDHQFNEGTLANKLSPRSESHDLSLWEAWHIFEIVNDVRSLMEVCRHQNMLLALDVGPLPVAEEALVPVFTAMRKELSETQDLIRQALEEKLSPRGTVSISTKRELRREVYEDLCAAMAMIAHLEAMAASENPSVGLPSLSERYEGFARDIKDWAESQASSQDNLEAFLARSDMRRADFERLRAEKNATLGPSFKLFLRAIEGDDTDQLLQSFCRSLGYRVFPLKLSNKAIATRSVLEQFADLEGRQADTLRKLNQALRDRCISAEELQDITSELEEEYNAELALIGTFTETR